MKENEYNKKLTLDAQLLVVSVDGVADHHKWIKDIERVFDTKVRFPLVSDVQRRISQAYGMIDQTTFFNGDKRSGVTVTVRSVFIISPSKKIQLMMSYPSTTGRNIDEVRSGITMRF